MEQPLKIYNTLTREKKIFKPLNAPHVGIYVCGPTLYSYAHLGNCRTFLSFDIVFRYLLHLEYKVRYVRNITDVGHLESDGDEGEDKIAKRARLEKLEPMEIVQLYAVDFHHVLEQFNLLPPSIEPAASGHIIEQIETTKCIIANGFAYEVDGTVWFDVEKFAKTYPYTQLSGRKLDELFENTRELEGQSEKRGRLDFALWKKAKPEHIMRWPSPWGEGFPGWHIECSAMSTKYLGEEFDIHGGGMDLIPTHHTNEIAQHAACYHKSPAKVWVHTNMLTVNGQKMSKSLGNSILPHELFAGKHKLWDRDYSPMTVRFFMLQAHYRSTLDLSDTALQGAEIAYKRLASAFEMLNEMQYDTEKVVTLDEGRNNMISNFNRQIYYAMNDDFNTAKVLAEMFGQINNIVAFTAGLVLVESIQKETFENFKKTFSTFFTDILGLKVESGIKETKSDMIMRKLMNIIQEIRVQARVKKDFATSDAIRDKLKEAGVKVNDGKEGITWSIDTNL